MPKRYDFKAVEARWRKFWQAKKVYEPDLKRTRKPFYNLMMFPYPSAEGLHIGGVRTFTGVDVYGRFKRMQGYDVFQPIGLDGFGINAENYALKIGQHPLKLSKVTEKNFYRQLGMIGNGFAWDEKIETYNPDYYRWTQWIFTQMFKWGLAYRKKQAVNWCPADKTVLADEQVISGKCERCGSTVEKKDLEQWFFKITEYADRLDKNLDLLDWAADVKIAQRNWIGRSEGAEIEFLISQTQHAIKVFTTRPDTLFGATYLVLAPEHPLVEQLRTRIQNMDEVGAYVVSAKGKSEEDRLAVGREKTGVELIGVRAINPATREEVAVWVADYVLGSYGTGAIMAVPAHDERDFEFAKKFSLPMRIVIGGGPKREEQLSEAYSASGPLVNSDKWNGASSEKAKWEIVKFAGGKRKTQYRLRDWLLSRQRYWGAPIPMIHCEACAVSGRGERVDMPGWFTVPARDLPVKLPNVKEFRPTGTDHSPLATVESFYKVRCPQCKGWARRETDVCDTFLDSSWYFLRYPSAKEKKNPWSKAAVKKWLPVHSYIGGKEHSVLHLLYSRFLTMAFRDQGLLDFEEPFARFRAHGLITKDGAKMSKSKGNVVNPDEYWQEFGADVMRMYLAFMAPLDQGGDFRDAGIMGLERFLHRFWQYFEMREAAGKIPPYQDDGGRIPRALHRAAKKVGEDIEALKYNTAISALMVFMNELETLPQTFLNQKDSETLVKLMAPFAPFMAEEIWHRFLGKTTSIHREAWPKYDPKFLAESSFELIVQVNGKLRDTISISAEATEEEATSQALQSSKVQAYLNGQAPRRVIYVPRRLINIVF